MRAAGESDHGNGPPIFGKTPGDRRKAMILNKWERRSSRVVYGPRLSTRGLVTRARSNALANRDLVLQVDGRSLGRCVIRADVSGATFGFVDRARVLDGVEPAHVPGAESFFKGGWHDRPLAGAFGKPKSDVSSCATAGAGKPRTALCFKKWFRLAGKRRAQLFRCPLRLRDLVFFRSGVLCRRGAVPLTGILCGAKSLVHEKRHSWVEGLVGPHHFISLLCGLNMLHDRHMGLLYRPKSMPEREAAARLCSCFRKKKTWGSSVMSRQAKGRALV